MNMQRMHYYSYFIITNLTESKKVFVRLSNLQDSCGSIIFLTKKIKYLKKNMEMPQSTIFTIPDHIIYIQGILPLTIWASSFVLCFGSRLDYIKYVHGVPYATPASYIQRWTHPTMHSAELIVGHRQPIVCHTPPLWNFLSQPDVY